jgi:hypothetical protein
MSPSTTSRSSWHHLRLVILLGLASIVTAGCGSEPREDEFWAACKKAVLLQLKAPRTAVFAEKPSINVTVKSRRALITAEVDAQNSFGALLRSKFQCMRGFGSAENQDVTVVFEADSPEALLSGSNQDFVMRMAATQFMLDVLREDRRETEERLQVKP